MIKSSTLRNFKLILASVFVVILLSHCKGSEVLAPAPSAQDLDHLAPSCPGISSLSVSSGPTINVIYGAATDDVTAPSKINYYIYMKSNSGSYDLVSPTKIIVGSTSTTVTSGVSTGQSYTLFVACRDEAGNISTTVPVNEASITVSDSTPPSQISDLAANAPTYTSILLTWSPSDDGAGGTTSSNIKYRIFASLSSPVSTAGSYIAEITGTTSYLHSGLNPNEHWYYRVVARDSTGNQSSDSNQANNTSLADTAVPTFPTGSGITAGSTTTSSIPLSWNAGADNVTSTAGLVYQVYRCSGSVTCNPFALAAVKTTAAGVTSYTDNVGLQPSTVYVYGVKVRDSSGNLSTNTDVAVTSTAYSPSGDFFVYPTLAEKQIRQGADVQIANVIGDSNADLIVGAPLASQPNGPYRQNGCVFIYAGTGGGHFSPTPSQIICQPPSGVVTDGNAGVANNFIQIPRNFGTAVLATDLDGDGIMDLVVSNPNLNTIYFYLGTRVGGISSLPSSPNANMNNPSGATYFGMGLCAGDFDNAGANDLVVVSSGETCAGGCTATTGTGNINIYSNTSAGGGFVVPQLSSLIWQASPTAQLKGSANGITYNFNVSNGPTEQVVRKCAVGKFDPTTPAETQLVVSSGVVGAGAGGQTDGIVSFYRVAAKGAVPAINYQNSVLGTAMVGSGTAWGESVSAVQVSVGTTMALAIGAPNDTNSGTDISGAGGNGVVYLYNVSTDGSSNFQLSDVGYYFGGGRDFNGNGIGQAVTAGNIFGHVDGTQDIAIGAWLDDQSFISGATIDIGDVYIHKNASGSFATTATQSGFDPSSLIASTNQEFGWSMCYGDVNNDGIGDVIIGSPRQDYDGTTQTTKTDVGAVYIYYGKAAGEIDFANPSQVLYGPGDAAGGLFGASCAVMDYDGDGSNDLVVGSPSRAVGGLAGRGAVFIYKGAPSSPLPVSNSDILNPPAGTGTANMQFGYSLAIGDFDGNGKKDLAVGAIGTSTVVGAGIAGVPAATYTNAGRVFVYFANGSGAVQSVAPAVRTLLPPTGPTGTAASAGNYCGNPNLTNLPKPISNMNFGASLAAFPTRPKAAGILGTDLVVCAPGYTSVAQDFSGTSPATTGVGICYIYEGSVNVHGDGSSLAGEMSTCPTDDIRYWPAAAAGYPNNANFGSSMTVGVLPGSDNAPDLLICARQSRTNDVSQTQGAGSCYLYQQNADGSGNSAGGFDTYNPYHPNANARLTPLYVKAIDNPSGQIEGSIANQYSYFGQSVLVQDINNNGSSDLLVGEPWSDSRKAISGGNNPQATLGKDSGRVYILRGGFWP